MSMNRCRICCFSLAMHDMKTRITCMTPKGLSKLETLTDSLYGNFPAINRTQPFIQAGINVYACPWLRWLESVARSNGDDFGGKVEGILIMQDWFNQFSAEDHNIQAEVNYLDVNFRKSSFEWNIDRTNYNLCNSPWGSAILSGKWLVTNAVWGVRSSANQSGPLSVVIHKTAFLVWWQLLEMLGKTGLKVVIAGSWGLRQSIELNSPMELQDFIDRYKTWASRGRGKIQLPSINNLTGMVYFDKHPCIWHHLSQKTPP